MDRANWWAVVHTVAKESDRTLRLNNNIPLCPILSTGKWPLCVLDYINENDNECVEDSIYHLFYILILNSFVDSTSILSSQ